MRVIIAGGHGQIALRLERLLTRAGHTAVGLIRNPDHGPDIEAAGAVPVVCDLEKVTIEDVAEHLSDADAAVFAAGAGPGSGAARKDVVDRAASVLLADATQAAGVRRFVQISAIGASTSPDPEATDVFSEYLRAKAAAEDDLRRRDLDWTILRPGRLTDDPGTDRVRLGTPPMARSDVTRDDVAAVIAELLITGNGARRTLVLIEGDTPVAKAVAQLGDA